MELSDVYVGQRVKDSRYGEGQVIAIDARNPELFLPVLVEWDTPSPRFHDGGGRGKINHCWWMHSTPLDEVTECDSFSISLSFDSLVGDM